MSSQDATLDFDEEFYLSAHPDIAQAVGDGVFASGYEHYLQYGRAEGRPTRAIVTPTPELFDEEWYLAEYPDVANAVKAGYLQSGYQHWLQSGKAEGRIAPPGYDEGEAFDADWYEAVYHAVAEDIAAGRARDAADHYQRLGRHRGYLPNRFAPRPENPTLPVSVCGGFWLDQANAADLIEGRRELGRISPETASLLHDWVENGYVVLRQAIDPAIIERAAASVRAAYRGEIGGLKFECPAVGGYHPIAWDARVESNPAKALDFHWLSEEIRDLIFAPPVREFLELVFERRAMATQSLTFLRGSGQGYHQDTLYVPFSLPTQFVASWIALEDVQPGGGELTYFPGSHRLPDFLFGGKFKTLWDAQRILRRNSLREEMADYSQRLEQRSAEAGLAPAKFMAKKGDVLLWHADLAHGGLPISNEATRQSVVTHYCPQEVASLTFERGRTARRNHKNIAWYATGYYAED